MGNVGHTKETEDAVFGGLFKGFTFAFVPAVDVGGKQWHGFERAGFIAGIDILHRQECDGIDVA